MRMILGWVGRIGLWVIIIGCSAILVVAVLIPRIGGAAPYTIMTGSMRPTLPPGTLAVVRPLPVTKIGVGDVITYQLRSGDPTVVTHRVVEQGINTRHGVLFRTKGDANNTDDVGWVQPAQVKGTVWYSVPLLGYPAQLLTGREHRLLGYLAAAALLGYAAYMFGSAFRDRRRASHEHGSPGHAVEDGS